MKLNKSLILGVAGVMMLSSCNDWLDVNTNPNTPTDMSADYYQRLAHIEFYTSHMICISGRPTSFLGGDLTSNRRTTTTGGVANDGYYAQWNMTEWNGTTSYQWWFVGAAANLGQMIKFAEDAEAWHYAGVGYLIKALGFAMMNDLYGELPYSDALGENVTPVYDTGKEMFEHVLEDIDKGLEYLQMPQGADAVPLAANDAWAQGDVNKWIKFGYLLKARQLNKLYKKGAGNASDLKWDVNAILACLDKAQQSNADNITYRPTDSGNTPNDNLGWGEPTDWSGFHSIFDTNYPIYMQTRRLYDNLTNFAGYNVEDPRADKILMWAHNNGQDAKEAYGQTIKYSGEWRRTVGVDMNTLIRMNGTIEAPSWVDGQFKIKVENHEGDTVFVALRSSSTGFNSKPNMFYYVDANNDPKSALSGCFYSRPTTPLYIGSYAEACFIRAEILFSQGNKSGAYEAYKNGIKANIDEMNEQLAQWLPLNNAYADCPSFTLMTQADIDNFLNKGIGTANDITLGKIMTQKHIAMMYSPEQWNDMRRYDYNPEIFLNWHVPAEYYVNADAQLKIPMGKYPRRNRVSSHEYNYNTANLNAIGEYLVRDGAKWTGPESTWWNELDMWTIPVWWDTNHAD
ncbi:MAG: SusD/RagB family nutrient-binding outer membrane lipoprotein [Muribaculaceae bacterium]|nr:SusD/RagB family nutrient-binding outer membrane lipoprotein [Muribaculaceae bacterium]